MQPIDSPGEARPQAGAPPACESCRQKDQQLARLKDELNEALEDLARTREVLANCQRALYGRSSERIVDAGFANASDHQGDENPAASQGADGAQGNRDPKSKRNRSKPKNRTEHGWGKLPDDLERRPQTHDVPEEERVCPECGGELVRIGEDETERVEIDPPKLYAKQIVRPKYICPNCKASGVKQAPAPPSPRPSSRFDFQFVAHVTVSKFAGPTLRVGALCRSIASRTFWRAWDWRFLDRHWTAS